MNARWPIINLIVTILSVAGVYAINTGLTPLESVGEVQSRNQFTNLTLPPGFTFSIWGIIYLGFIVFAFYQAFNKRHEPSKFHDAQWLITLSIALNLLWVIMVGFNMFVAPYPLQWLMMIVSLIIVIRILRSGRAFQSKFEQVLFGTFALYAGWLTVAMIPYTTNVLMATGWDGAPFSRETWAIAVYVIACVIVYAAYRRTLTTLWYPVPLVWALFGIAIKFSGAAAIAAGTLSAVGLVWIGFEYFRSRRHSQTADRHAPQKVGV